MDTKKLRQKILDLAIHGKLVPQDPNDEPASVLLERIRAEKERLISEGKIKRSRKTVKTADTHHYEQDVPFDVPKGWVWTTLGAINDIARGGSPRPIKDFLTDDEDGVNWIKISDTTRDGKYIDSVKERIRKEGVKKSRMVYKGDFLLTNSMSFGRPYILNVDGCIHDGWLVISPIGNAYTADFLYYLLSSSFALDQFTEVASGGVVINLNSAKVSDTLFPLPPIGEQQRIAVEIEHWFTFIDIIEQGKVELQTAIKQTKSKILDLAIHGKLVPQDPSDEPASELLKRINPKAQIPCDTEHYAQLPKGWTCIKLGSVARYINGRAFKPEEWMTEGLPIIRIQNLNDDTAYYNRSTSEFEEKYRIKKGDLLFAWAASLGAFLWQGEDAWLNQHIFKVEPYPFIGKMFLYYAFRGLIDEFYRNSHGSGMVHITKRQFEDIYLSLPPLEEQKRIVETINIFFNVLDTIKENL